MSDVSRGTDPRERLSKHVEGGILLGSIPKSGTNLVKLFLANYFNLINGNEDRLIEYNEMHHDFFYSGRQILTNESLHRSKSIFIEKSGYKSLTHIHNILDVSKIVSMSEKLEVIFLYRNPADNLVSSYYYHYKNRDHAQNIYESPACYISDYAKKYARHYLEIQKSESIGFLASYDLIMKDKFQVFKDLLEYLNVEVRDSYILKAIEYSDIKSVRNSEKKMGKPIYSKFGTSFIRSGMVKDYENYLSVLDIKYLKSCFINQGVDFDYFMQNAL